LELERLEDRLAPAAMNLTVNTLNDDPNGPMPGQTTLRDAINTADQAANAGSTIQFQAGLNGIIQLQAVLPDLSQNMTIQGPGHNVLSVNGVGAQNPFRVFEVDPNKTVTISGLQIANGYVNNASGGGIYNFGNLTLVDDYVVDNQAVGANSGGGITNGIDATLELDECYVEENSAAGSGGGIWNLGTLRLFYNDEILDNGAGDDGGGLASLDGVVHIGDSTVLAGNSALWFGGGIYLNGGTVTMSGGSMLTNYGGIAGGGLYVAAGSLTLTAGVTIGPNNQAAGNGGAGDGGGVFLASKSTATFDGCTVSGNQASAQGVGVYEQNGATVNIISLTDNDDPGGKPVQGP
jgi:hypothetical protein